MWWRFLLLITIHWISSRILRVCNMITKCFWRRNEDNVFSLVQISDAFTFICFYFILNCINQGECEMWNVFIQIHREHIQVNASKSIPPFASQQFSQYTNFMHFFLGTKKIINWYADTTETYFTITCLYQYIWFVILVQDSWFKPEWNCWNKN